MLIFHVLMVMRLLGREGASGQRGGFRTVYGASRQRGSPPVYAPTYIPRWWRKKETQICTAIITVLVFM